MLEITNALLRDHLKEKLRARSPLRRSPDLHEGADCFFAVVRYRRACEEFLDLSRKRRRRDYYLTSCGCSHRSGADTCRNRLDRVCANDRPALDSAVHLAAKRKPVAAAKAGRMPGRLICVAKRLPSTTRESCRWPRESSSSFERRRLRPGLKL